jgi:hypothetical protein
VVRVIEKRRSDGTGVRAQDMSVTRMNEGTSWNSEHGLLGTRGETLTERDQKGRGGIESADQGTERLVERVAVASPSLGLLHRPAPTTHPRARWMGGCLDGVQGLRSRRLSRQPRVKPARRLDQYRTNTPA